MMRYPSIITLFSLNGRGARGNLSNNHKWNRVTGLRINNFRAIFCFKCLSIVILLVYACLFSVYPAQADNITQKQLTEINQLWQSSAHALADINCSSCHQNQETKQLMAQPTQESCRSCHEYEVDTFLLGKHGIRTLEGLSPLTPAMAHVAMKDNALGKQMNCNACHNVHSVNTYQAAVDSCLTCHNDSHSLNYQNSRHAQIFNDFGTLPRPNQESVTCAACHLPRQNIDDTILVNHNNTYTLLPRDRMVKEVCMNCHGVEYSYNSIFDDELVESNFARPPNHNMETFTLIRQREQKRKRSSQATSE